MPDPTSIDLTPADVQKVIDLKISASAQLPGEALLVALIGFAGKVRDSMNPALQARLDAVMVQQMEDTLHVWRHIWVALGLVPKI